MMKNTFLYKQHNKIDEKKDKRKLETKAALVGLALRPDLKKNRFI
jgi:hypothetical protein